MNHHHPFSCILCCLFIVGMLVLPAFAVSTPAEFAQEVAALYTTGSGALAPSDDPLET